jgi:beta-N-acetylhexosaminidase
MVGFDGATADPPDRLVDAIARRHVSGVILFARNVDSVRQVTELTSQLQAATPDEDPPLLIGVDQEGGRVMRIRESVTSVPPMWDVWQQGGRRAVREASHTLATELAEMGFNLNFAPVLDVRTNPENEVIGDRAFSKHPEEVAEAARAFIRAHHQAGVLTCGKHFPGHGDTRLDSHEALPVVEHPPERLRHTEFPPFEAAINMDVPAVMTAHILVSAIDAEHPATLSPKVLEYLRGELEFDGAIVSDDIEMDALADRYSIDEIADLGLEAGIDMFLVCHTWHKANQLRERLAQRADSNDDVAERLLESASTTHRMRQRL